MSLSFPHTHTHTHSIKTMKFYVDTIQEIFHQFQEQKKSRGGKYRCHILSEWVFFALLLGPQSNYDKKVHEYNKWAHIYMTTDMCVVWCVCCVMVLGKQLKIDLERLKEDSWRWYKDDQMFIIDCMSFFSKFYLLLHLTTQSTDL